jgi:hypothetical protein
LFKGVSRTVRFFTVASGLLPVSVLLETFVEVLASVTVFARTIFEEVKTEFCFVFEVKGGFVSHLLIVMGKGALGVKKELRIC